MNVISSNTGMLVGVPIAALHVVLKMRFGETKILGSVSLTLSNCCKGLWLSVLRLPFEKGPKERAF